VILPDANVLLYAFRRDSEDHALYRRWLDAVVNGTAAYGMSPQVLARLMRIATHPRIFVRPSGLNEATAFASLLLDQPHCQVIQPGSRHWSIFVNLCARAKVSGVVGSARNRVGMRMDHHRPRLRPLRGIAVASAVLILRTPPRAPRECVPRERCDTLKPL
jgi:hypothetical protein